MGTRISAGMAIAGVPFTFGLFVLGDRRREAATLFGVAAFVLLLAFAHRLPVLHRLPVVGAPEVKLAGRQTRSEHTGKDIHIEVLVVSSTRLEDAGLSLTFPDSVALHPFDGLGRPLEGVMIPTFELGTGLHEWVLHQMLPFGATPFRFILETSGGTPFEFLVVVRVQSEKLYRNRAAFDFAVSTQYAGDEA